LADLPFNFNRSGAMMPLFFVRFRFRFVLFPSLVIARLTEHWATDAIHQTALTWKTCANERWLIPAVKERRRGLKTGSSSAYFTAGRRPVGTSEHKTEPEGD